LHVKLKILIFNFDEIEVQRNKKLDKDQIEKFSFVIKMKI